MSKFHDSKSSLSCFSMLDNPLFKIMIWNMYLFYDKEFKIIKKEYIDNKCLV